jgi:hypothetical protein
MMIDPAHRRGSVSLSRVAVVLAVVAAAALVLPTGGFSSVQADRGVDVAVVPDSGAYLGVDITASESDGGQYGDTAIGFVAFCANGSSGAGSVNVTTVASKTSGAGEPMRVEWDSTVGIDTAIVKNGSGSEVDWVTGLGGATSGTLASNDGVPKNKQGNDICPEGQSLVEKVDANFETADEVAETGGSATLSVEVTNRFAGPIDATVTVEGTSEELSSMAAGDSKTAEFDVDCDDPVTVSVDASGPGVDVHLDRHVCDGDGTPYE